MRDLKALSIVTPKSAVKKDALATAGVTITANEYELATAKTSRRVKCRRLATIGT